ncbi:transmembrane protease serine 11D-like [Oppia nitens]|uniref:transmembrane protease serine 11D-like n=1 Tax=Oppia nitens TaxID=1686743 RepID=UPI0023D9D5AA|nr:transmembrane protease serine 11D-like [Oppia nitens]
MYSYIRYPGIDYGINKVIVHENNSAVNDLALINVKIPMNFSANNGYYYRQINGICLPTIDHNNTDYEYAVIAGFGRTEGNGLKSELQIGWLRINPMDTQNNDPNLIYAVTYLKQSNGSLICYGDTGGPLIQYVRGRAVLIGVAVDWWSQLGILCEDYEPMRMYFIRVATKINWIIDKIRKNTI